MSCLDLVKDQLALTNFTERFYLIQGATVFAPVCSGTSNYVMIYTSNSKFLTLLPLKTVEAYLDSGKFLSVHKSYLVAITKIDSIDGNNIRIQQHSIPISRNLRDEVIEVVVKSKLMSR